MDKKRIGEVGEMLVVEHLSDMGFTVIDRNYRTKYGELDIVAIKRGEVHFVEVKTRTGDAFGLPGEAVDRKKQSHLRLAARIYIESKRLYSYNVCFDVAELELRYIENCF